MAKVAFFCESLHAKSRIGSHAFEVATIVAEHRNEVRVITTRSDELQLPSSHWSSHLEILAPIVSWSALEMPKILRILFEFRPDIIFLVQPHGNYHRKIFSLFQFLVYPFPFLPTAKTVFCLFDLTPPYNELKFYRHLLEKSNVITVFNEKQKHLVHEVLRRDHLKVVDVLPFPSPLAQNPLKEIELPTAFPEKFLAIPGSLSDHREPEILFESLYQFLQKFPYFGVLILGGREQFKVRRLRFLISKLTESGFWENVLFTGPLTTLDEFNYIKKSCFIWLSTLPQDGLLFEDSLSAALLSHRPMVVHNDQMEERAKLAKDDTKIFAEPLTIEGQVRGLCQAALTTSVQPPTDDFLRTLSQNRDRLGNELSRIFSRR